MPRLQKPYRTKVVQNLFRIDNKLIKNKILEDIHILFDDGNEDGFMIRWL